MLKHLPGVLSAKKIPEMFWIVLFCALKQNRHLQNMLAMLCFTLQLITAKSIT